MLHEESPNRAAGDGCLLGKGRTTISAWNPVAGLARAPRKATRRARGLPGVDSRALLNGAFSEFRRLVVE